MKKEKSKFSTIYILIIVVLLIILGVGGVHQVQEHQRKVAIENEEKRKALKKYETEIVEDLANNYAGIKSVEFDKYSVSPMGYIEWVYYINGYVSNDISMYQMDIANDKKPYASELGKLNVKKGKSDFNQIKIKYNYEEDKR
ncbi:hypothetical protein [Fructilactobacillus carniphilus]|uniref:DUF1433 domain-containing protein n=1 Tax=Fructilactobacillus carniphilus TaxID=2940297 RepID=A0ABY5BY55_9LACO|nr:hypothetical protein [Fructilactobacillus carniphilus]USS90568.1 hypothetical protein M3M37_06970 [Fructilactobacillus carniphilus]